ncbi:thioesterase [Streptomyces sp. JJ66]|nr:thioesterase [Streptomyces sp. JJ66]
MRVDHRDPWFRRYRVDGARVRLVCFPHAGGAATSYLGWPQLLPEGVEMLAVQYPGRQSRIAEPCFESLPELATAVTVALKAHSDLPLTLFGHSMGSAIAYEVARALRQDGREVPRLLVSGRGSPHVGYGDRRPPGLDDRSLIAVVRALSGSDADAYEHPEMRDLLMPSLRADYTMLDRYRPTAPAEPLDVPVTVFGGEDDPACPVSELASWAHVTSAGCEVLTYPGGHFYLREHERALVAEVARRLPVRKGPAA